ncbi:MAG TPA: hypothetical protein VIT38_17100 [Allosphingosinicella sp.]
MVYEFVISEALRPMGYEIERADKLSEPGIITNQIIDRVTSADIVIADLSERNPNVFYELAIRHAARKPYVHLIAHDEDIPFDNAAVRAIKVDIHDLRNVKAAKEELERQVTAAMATDARVESPVSIALSMQDMRTSGDEEKLAISALSGDISQLKRSMKDLVSLVTSVTTLTRSRNRFADFPDVTSSRTGLTTNWSEEDKILFLNKYDSYINNRPAASEITHISSEKPSSQSSPSSSSNKKK